MIKKILPVTLICICFLSFSQKIQSQNNRDIINSVFGETDYHCGTYVNPSQSFFGGMPHKTTLPGQYLKILIIYVRFPDDDFLGDQMNGAGVWWNPIWDNPSNPYTSNNSFIDPAEGNPSTDFMNRYTEYTISDYFSEMSRGQLDVIGDEISIMLPYTSAQYIQKRYTYAEINREAIQQADSIYNIDFAAYNNWTLNNDNVWEWMPRGGDNRADMIVMVYRRAPTYPETRWFFNLEIPISGIADLGYNTPLTLDSTELTFASGVTCLSLVRNYSRMTQIIEHEICHRYFSRHFEMGLMTGVEHTSFSLSPRERWTLEYITPVEINSPYKVQSQTFTLGDFIATGDMVALNLGETERFLIANHQKVSKYDGYSQGGNTCWTLNKAQQDPYCGFGKGLFIYHEAPAGNCNFLKEIIIEPADGRFNWYIDRWVQYYVPEFDFQIPLFERVRGNPFGKGEYHQVLDSISNIYQQEVTDNPCTDSINSYFVTLDWRGDGLDGFNMGYDEIFSPYSNPRSDKCNRTKTGLTVKLLSMDSVTGNITVKIYYDDNLALEELPPSKPKNLSVTKSVVDSLTGMFHPKLKWDLNIEPDFITGGLYKIYRGTSLTCNPNEEPEYELIDALTSSTIEYTDLSINLFPYGGGPVACQGLFRSLSYKIEAADNTNMPSLKSDRSIINGYISHCDDSVLVGIGNNQVPLEFSVYNYPNPFNPSTQIKFSLPKSAMVTLRVYNLLGEEITSLVNNEYKAAGRYSVTFDGSNLSSGIYLYTIQAGDFRDSKKMVLIK